MGVIIPQVVTEDRASGAQVIDGSLRFDKDKLTYLSWTPSSSGNRNNWTISCWIKRGKIGVANQRMFHNSTSNFSIRFGSDVLQWTDAPSGANGENTPTAVLRDTGWYHLVFAWDSSAGVNGNAIYLNGQLLQYVQTGAGNPNTSSAWNVAGELHTIGANQINTGRYYDGMMTQCYFIDGQTLGPENFGYTDPLTGTWRPKKYTGSVNAAAIPGTTFDDATSGTPFANTSDEGQTLGSGYVSGATTNAILLVPGYNLTEEGTSNSISNLGATGTTTSKWYGNAIQFGTAASEGNVEKCLSYGTALGLSGASNFTFEAWVYPRAGSNNYNMLFEGDWQSNHGILFRLNTSRQPEIYFGDGGFQFFTSDLIAPADQWSHVAIVCDNNTMRFFVNGTMDVKGTRTKNYTVGNGYRYIGAYRDTNYYSGPRAPFYGYMQDIRLTSDVKYNASFTVPGSGAVPAGVNGFYLPLDGNTPIGQDQSGNGNHWTPVNFGGSNTIEKATGALPILNTDGGGNVARLGTRTDAYASNLILAIPFIGNANDVSNQINSGTTTKTLTTNGNPTASSTSSVFYGGSFDFDASGDYFSIDLGEGLGTGDFTIECWAKSDTTSGSRGIFHLNDTSGGLKSAGGAGVNAVGLYQESSTGFYRMYINDGGSGNSLKPTDSGVWNHWAIVKSGSTQTMYCNGVNVLSGTSNTDLTTARYLAIGGYYSTTYLWDGCISDFRIYKGVAKYTSNFIPASTDPDILPDTPSGVSGSSKLTKVTDGAVSFDGADGTALQLSNHSDIQLGSGTNWTIEFFAYRTGAFVDYDVIAGKGAGGTYEWFIEGFADGSVDILYSADGSTTWTGQHEIMSNMALNRWYHIALVRNGSGANNFKAYVDGIQTLQTTAFDIYAGTGVLHIGGYNGAAAQDPPIIISNFRIVNGSSVYTSDFTPPTSALTNVTNTKLLCCQSNTSAGAADVSPNISGINDGTVWSDNFTSTSDFNSSYPPSNAFDGSDTTYAEPVNTGSTMTVTFDPPLVVSGDFEVKIGSSGELFTTINGGSSTSQGSGLTQYHTLGNNITVSNFTYTSSTRPVLYSVRVNGSTLLTDPISKKGNAAATNFNPFNTDINAVRGQESGYCTLNPLDIGPSSTLSNGNLYFQFTGGAAHRLCNSTISMSSGKWYWEGFYGHGTTAGTSGFGISKSPVNLSDSVAQTNVWAYHSNGNRYVNGSGSAMGATYTTGDLIGIAFDADSGTLYGYKNGVLQGTVATGLTSGPYFAVANSYSSSNWLVNFGQKPFKFPPPDGFQPLNASTVRPSTVIARPDKYFGTLLYTADVSAGKTVTGLNFGDIPDFVWIKNRDNVESHHLMDTVRGNSSFLFTNHTNVESSTPYNDGSGTLSFDFVRDGVSFTDSNYNSGELYFNSRNYIAYCWKAGGNSNTFNVNGRGYATASDAGLTGGTIALTGASVNTDAGFSILTFTGTGNAGSIPHGLTQAPDLLIGKNRDRTTDWKIYLPDTGNYVEFNLAAQSSVSNAYTGVTSSLINLQGTGYALNYSTDSRSVIYCWHNVEGLQKFGSYVANNSNDGPYIHLGFRPAMVIVRSINGATARDWLLWDSSRNTYNGQQTGALCPNGDFTESARSGAIYNGIDFLSGGFKLRTNGTPNMNASSETYIYMAWAEAPTFNLYGAQSNAR